MSRTRSATDVPPDRTNIIVTLSILLAIAAQAIGLPGFFVIALGMTIAGFKAQMPQLTGGKKGAPEPASDYERMEITRYRRRRDWRYRVLVPNPDWIAGFKLWPVKAGPIASLLIAGIAVTLPVAGGSWVLAGLNAYAAFGITAQYAASRRRHRFPDETAAPMAFDATLLSAVVTVGGKRWIGNRIAVFVLAGVIAVIAGIIGWFIHSVAWQLAAGLSLDGLRIGTGKVISGIVGFAAEIGKFDTDFSAVAWLMSSVPAVSPVVGIVCAALLGSAMPFLPLWRRLTLQPAKTRHEARMAWRPGWESMKYKPIPAIISRTRVGQLTIDTFDAPPGVGVGKFIGKEAEITPITPGGCSIAIAGEPNLDANGQPIPGSQHPSRFRIVSWPADQRPDLSDPSLDIEVAKVYMNALATPAAVKAAIAVLDVPVRFDEIEPLHSPESSSAAYRAVSATLAPNLYLFLRDATAGEPFGGPFGVPLVINHRPHKDGGCAFYFGDVSDPGFVPSEAAEETIDGRKTVIDVIGELSAEDYWRDLWAGTDVLPVGKLPIISHNAKTTASLADGTEIIRQGFMLRSGQSYLDLFGVEPRLRATAMRTPFASVTGFPDRRSREGDRKDGALYLSYCPLASSQGKPQQNARIPSGPIDLAPSQPVRGKQLAQTWVLAGRINEAFDAVRLARPEVTSARPLTKPDARRHIWEVKMRLHGSVTYDDVRAKSKKLRELLGDIPWLRVDYTSQMALLYIGADPETVELADERRDRPTIVGLDWAHAFDVAKIIGADGSLPQLLETHVMPENDSVRKIAFRLPSGVSIDRVKGAVSKLTGASGMGFISVSADSDPTVFHLTVARADPMPDKVGYDFDNPVKDGCLNFAVRVDGSSVFYDPVDSPHMMFAGSPGSGKSATGMNISFGVLAADWDLILIDPQKQAGDFAFAKHRSLATAITVEQARAALEYAYTEARKRAALNREYGVVNMTDLPEEVRPRRLFIFIDEFNNLISTGKRPPTKPEADPDMERSRLAAIADYEDRTRIAELANQIAAEARAAGVHVVVMGQKFPSDLMKSANTLKPNSARLLQGKTSYGDRASALRNPESAPDLGESVPKGRAIWESVSLPVEMIQTRFAEADEYAARLREIEPRLHPVSEVDLEPFMPKRREAFIEGEEIDASMTVYDGEADVQFDDSGDEVDVEIDESGSVDLSAIFGDSEAGDLDFGDADADDDLDFADDSADDDDLDFDDDPADDAEELDSDDDELDFETEDDPAGDDADDTDEPADELDFGFDDEEDDDLDGDVIVIDARALRVVQALPGAVTTVGKRNKVHIYTEAIDQLLATGATVVVTPGDGLEDVIAEVATGIEIAEFTIDELDEAPIAEGSRLAIIGADLGRKETSELKDLFADCQTLVVSASARAGVSIMQLNKIIGHFAARKAAV